jgi:hypothetical protein
MSEDFGKAQHGWQAGPSNYRNRVVALLVVVAAVAFVAVLWWLPRQSREQEGATARAKRLAIQAELAEVNSGSRSGQAFTADQTSSLVLAPINVRAAGPPNVLRRTGVAVFEVWLLPSSLAQENFKGLLTRDGANTAIEISNLVLTERAQGKAVRLRIPAQLLEAGTYQFELRAITTNGESIYLGEYRFQIAD